MLKIFACFFYFIIALGVAPQAAEDDTIKEGTEPAVKSLFFYQLEGANDLEAPVVYLFGTLHTLPHSCIDDSIKELMKKASILVKEVFNLRSWDFPELFDFADVTLETLQQKGYLDSIPPNWPDDNLTPEHHSILLKKFSLDLKNAWGLEVKGVPPSILNDCIKSNIEIRRQELLEKFSLTGFSNISAGRNSEQYSNSHQTIDSYINCLHFKKTYGLEDGHTRLETSGKLDQLAREKFEVSTNQLKHNIQKLLNLYPSSADEEAELAKKIHKKNINRQQLVKQLMGKAINEAYLNGDEEYLKEYIREDTTKRNKIWLPKIKDIIKNNGDSSILIIVGCAHLLGEDGLLNLLNQEGLNFFKVVG
ncbi:TraB/GumN family protein [Candidatus Paracaedibacter symbiosus]|uniref:TraB/GumN family protein n=1 Tax=Candidatus Paracaedibacter symbiosus TaxID=244582 RepID=UPI000509EAB6|nr:TraB/GumN family protein [Candidatus Paracaedibacter symbiosus]